MEFLRHEAEKYKQWAKTTSIPVNKAFLAVLEDADALCDKCAKKTKMLCVGERPVFDADRSVAEHAVRLRTTSCAKKKAEVDFDVTASRLDDVLFAGLKKHAGNKYANMDWKFADDQVFIDAKAYPTHRYLEVSASSLADIGGMLYGVVACGYTAQFVFPSAVEAYFNKLGDTILSLVTDADLLCVYPTHQLASGGFVNNMLLDALDYRVTVCGSPTWMFNVDNATFNGKNADRLAAFCAGFAKSNGV